MTVINVSLRRLRAALVDIWQENLRARWKYRHNTPYPTTVDEAKQSLPAVYVLFCEDYTNAGGGDPDWEIIPEGPPA